MKEVDFGRIRELIDMINKEENQITSWAYVMKHMPYEPMREFFEDHPENRWWLKEMLDSFEE